MSHSFLRRDQPHHNLTSKKTSFHGRVGCLLLVYGTLLLVGFIMLPIPIMISWMIINVIVFCFAFKARKPHDNTNRYHLNRRPEPRTFFETMDEDLSQYCTLNSKNQIELTKRASFSKSAHFVELRYGTKPHNSKISFPSSDEDDEFTYGPDKFKKCHEPL